MAERDCDCITHDGPHWLHMNLVVQRLNLALLEQVGTVLGLYAYGQEEARRLAELEDSMRRAGMADDEPIGAYLARTGWEQRVIDSYLSERSRIQTAVQAALTRLQQAKAA